MFHLFITLVTSYFYPRPPRGGRPPVELALLASYVISIHALREEGDGSTFGFSASRYQFLSTPSARRATSQNHNNTWSKSISIHALREEGDPGLGDQWFQDHQITIHALREEGDLL